MSNDVPAEDDCIGIEEQAANLILELWAEVARQARHIEELREKIDAEKSCACSFDAPGDVCAAHSPALMQAWEDGWFARDCGDADWHQNPYQRKKKETKP